MKPLRVLLLEPDLWRYYGIRHILRSDPEIDLLGEMEYNKILPLRRSPEHLKPEVVMLSYILLMDFKLPLLFRMRELFPRAHIFVHGYEERIDRIAAVFAAGAKGYFPLSSPSKDLLDALKLVGKGLIWGPPDAVASMIQQARRQRRMKLRGSEDELLTPYELTILKLLQKGMSNKEIAKEFGIAEVTVKSHLSKLYKKFNVCTRLQLLSYAISRNFIAPQKIRNKMAS
ncbi:MAG TPA: response regulator transcription factor [Candidatus Binatia bacterium]|jgi:two-component system nitrate/nitrite response regulator NarL